MAPTPGRNAYKPRKRHAGDEDATVQAYLTTPKPAFPLVAFLAPARGGTSQWVLLPLILMIAGLFRWATGLWSYSGFQTPPKYGDYEAQRHWMEITTQLPITQWYFYDPQWWGLDYPPLTAYHSWLLGKIGSSINPSWFALQSSRGFESKGLKVYMRATVLVSEYVVYVPALILFVRRVSQSQRVNRWEAWIALVAIMMQPALMLIDHAHFQYNTVMLGFMIATMAAFNAGRRLWGCVFFVAALGFKQMALYYAPAVFAYLLGTCIFPRTSIVRLGTVAIVTALSFAILFAPFVLAPLLTSKGTVISPEVPPLLQGFSMDRNACWYPSLLQMAQPIHRIFPFARGLFEDKVANFWCAAHTFHKLHLYPIPLLQQVSLAATGLSILPACIAILLHPERRLLPLALAVTAWGFFLFSFQVHEKSVLIPLMPMTLLLCGEGGLLPQRRAWITWVNILASWTMFPLLKRVELSIPYFVLTLLWAWLMGVDSLMITPKDQQSLGVDPFSKMVHSIFYFTMIVWHVLEAFIAPPLGKPDIWVVLNVLIGFAGFGIAYLWCLWSLWRSIQQGPRLSTGVVVASGRKTTKVQ